jgi:hypothetical protein
VQICLVYDVLYPQTVGGAERWYRNLALRLVDAGHNVTYLTMQNWDAEAEPDLPGVRVIAVTPGMPLYTDGRRRILPALVLGLGVLWHLLRHGSRYEWKPHSRPWLRITRLLELGLIAWLMNTNDGRGRPA